MFESKKRAFVFMLLAIVLGAVAVILFSTYMQETRASLGEFVTVQVAAEDIPAGTVIQPSLLTDQEVPRKYILDSLITSPQQLENKISVVPITKGSVITTSVLRNNTFVKGDYRQVMLRAPMAVFDEQIDAYDKVDILYSYDSNANDSKGNKGDKRVTDVLLKNVTVNSVQKTGNDITAIGVLVKLSDSKSVIWALNYAKEVRLLKSGSSKDVGSDSAATTGDGAATNSATSSTGSSATGNTSSTDAAKDKAPASQGSTTNPSGANAAKSNQEQNANGSQAPAASGSK
ncbi:SAF domain-containing protein [Paenibacillus hunanensis]|uniref:Flp pilus assembly protein CpaB n=1 Tax=Paenibacillus hunanensis TaxID=539262 RepID=UPI002025F82C|nr:SAF domain-containing protein [Paenibacillus hunanensis]MCL9661262.1 SAF domain-containing protein [Paenibacillus hunanensis]